MQRSSRPASLDQAQGLLASVTGRPLASRAERARLAEQLAALLLRASLAERRAEDLRRAERLGRLMGDPRGLAFTTELTDRAYRSADPGRVALALQRLVRSRGVPRYLHWWERAELATGAWLAGALPGVVSAGVQRRIREEIRGVLLSAHPAAVRGLLTTRHAERTRVNLNQLGEALLGEAQAEARVDKYSALARQPEVDALSVKVSSIGSQLSPLAFEDTVHLLSERLARIYQATLERPAAERPIVMLDMEAYRHVELTLAVMQHALSRPELDEVRAGVVLQAYLPESARWHEELIAWAEARVRRGARPIRLRIVKGANLSTERVESAKAGSAVPIYAHKLEVDANYKLLLERHIQGEAFAAVALGVASHNLFDLAYALLLARERGADERVGLEMLEGMADPLRRSLSGLGVDVLVYAPVCDDRELNTGIAYLVRRLEENTSADNFLSASFAMQPDDENFARERARFRASIARMDDLSHLPRRAGEASFDRRLVQTRGKQPPERAFDNEPDTDFSQAVNRRWIEEALTRLRAAPAQHIASLVLGSVSDAARSHAGADPSRPGRVAYEVALASPTLLEHALRAAADDATHFSQTDPHARASLLRRVAQRLRASRDELIALMVLDGGKRVTEADSEVSEAIDFAEYYRASYLALLRELPVRTSPRGVVVVTPPWNFPLAIPAGGVLAALMAGNRVLLKPALETALIAHRMVTMFHEAGVPRAALQLVLCDDEVGSALIRDLRVNAVILTGATDTARLFQGLHPGVHLLAETGGKNAYIVSAMSDRDQAIADVVYSAFGHAGQKCSAASLLILEAEVHDDPSFMATLKDAVESLPVGSAWDPKSVVTPLIHPPRGPLLRAMEQLEPGESWLVKPVISPDNPNLLSPGVKLGVQPGSFTHQTELFGPVLSVMRARDLAHAVELANGTGYGLTAGLASLDEDEQAAFARTIMAGNLYINRSTTGAIVRRQPFGGLAKSGFGPGAKAGGPNYVMQLCHVAAESVPALARPSPREEELLRPYRSLVAADTYGALAAMLSDYVVAQRTHFGVLHDPSRVLGQDNVFRYLPDPHVVVRAEADASLLDLAASALAARVLGVRLTLSLSPRFAGPHDSHVYGHPVSVGEPWSLRGQVRPFGRLRLLGKRTQEHAELAAELGVHIADAPVLPVGRLELLHYVREQSVCIEYHRYGQIPRERSKVV